MKKDILDIERDTDRTTKGIKLCAKWLSFCLSHGWKKEQLDGLEKIWWEHHNGNGNLKP